MEEIRKTFTYKIWKNINRNIFVSEDNISGERNLIICGESWIKEFTYYLQINDNQKKVILKYFFS